MKTLDKVCSLVFLSFPTVNFFLLCTFFCLSTPHRAAFSLPKNKRIMMKTHKGGKENSASLQCENVMEFNGIFAA